MEITSDDYEEAASFRNRCREMGIQGSNTDFLICAVAVRNDLSIFTTDEDFTHFAKILPIVLHNVAECGPLFAGGKRDASRSAGEDAGVPVTAGRHPRIPA